MAIIVRHSDTPLGRLAIERAVEEARRRDRPVVLTAHVAVRRNEEDARTYPDRHRKVEQELQRTVAKLRADGVDCVAYLPSVPSSAADALLDAAAEHNAELIVVGIRRRSPVGKALLGSTSQQVLLQADCDVLGVKLPTAENA